MKTYDLTEKMDFEGNPIIKIKDTKLEVIADAKTVLSLIDVHDQTQDEFLATIKAYEIIFSDSDKKKIDKLKLNSHDFSILVNHALAIAMGVDPDEEQGNA